MLGGRSDEDRNSDFPFSAPPRRSPDDLTPRPDIIIGTRKSCVSARCIRLVSHAHENEFRVSRVWLPRDLTAESKFSRVFDSPRPVSLPLSLSLELRFARGRSVEILTLSRRSRLSFESVRGFEPMGTRERASSRSVRSCSISHDGFSTRTRG